MPYFNFLLHSESELALIHLIELWACLVWRKRSWSWGGKVEREEESANLFLGIQCQEWFRAATSRDSEWALGNISLPREWPSAETAFLEREAVDAPSLSVFRRLWTMPSIKIFESQAWSNQAVGLDDHCGSLSPWLFCSVLFCSIVFYSSLEFISWQPQQMPKVALELANLQLREVPGKI